MATTKGARTGSKSAGGSKPTASARARKAPAQDATAPAARNKTAAASRTAKNASRTTASSKKKPATKGPTAAKAAGSKARSGKSSAGNTSRRTRQARMRVLTGPVRGIAPYKPKRGESYMNELQLAHFRNILLAWKQELMEEVDRTMHHMKDDAANFPDPNDRATQESEFGLELRTRDRDRKLLRKIDSALSRIDDGSYGYCEETGEEIGLRRLEARPVATLCLEAQERRELAERQFRDREDYYR